MSCPDEYSLAEFAEGKLPSDQAEAIESHLKDCADCQLVVSWVRERTGESWQISETAAEKAKLLGPVPETIVRGDSIGRYIIIDRVGEGGMGVVFSAYDPELDRRVALKVLRPEHLFWSGDIASVRLLREAQAMARVVHPNVVGVHDVLKMGDTVVIAMEFIEGVNLATWLRSEERSWTEIRDVFLQAARGLVAAHGVGLVHRDFKPANVMVDELGRVRVTDFGLVRQSLDSEDDTEAGEETIPSPGPSLLDSPVTRTGAVMGTPAYMAPEQKQGGPVDPRADQFSFCVAMWEALFKQRPYPTAASLKTTVLPKGNPSRPAGHAEIPNDVSRALTKGLRLDPKKRFDTMDEIVPILAGEKHQRPFWDVLAAVVGFVVVWALFIPALVSHDWGGWCTVPSAAFAGIWDEAGKRDVRSAFLATGTPQARAAYEQFAAEVNDFTRTWHHRYDELCQQKVSRDDPEGRRVLECLEDARGALRLLTHNAKQGALSAQTPGRIASWLEPCVAKAEP